VNQILEGMAPTDVVVDDVAPLDADLSYPEHPMKLFGQQYRIMRP
jgi:hypothetical protein